MVASKLATAFLALATLALFIAWQEQTAAGDALATARRIQNIEIPDSGAEPASADDYREIVKSLDRSIAIRTRIDGLLTDVEKIVTGLNETQERAIATAETTQGDVSKIGRVLAGSIEASRDSVAGLRTLEARLARSARLGGAIAEELEELDESLGPSLVLP
jgi:hypothetical protein